MSSAELPSGQTERREISRTLGAKKIRPNRRFQELGKQYVEPLVDAMKELEASLPEGVAKEKAKKARKLALENLSAVATEIETAETTDPLTGLYNKEGITRRYEQRMAEREAGKFTFFILLDLDSFKNINDGYGQGIGDRVIQTVAKAIQKAVSKDLDVAARIGGDEYGILLSNVPNRDVAKEILRRIGKSLKGLKIEGLEGEINVTFSAGCVEISLQESLSYEQIMKLAEQAKDIARINGKAGFTFAHRQESLGVPFEGSGGDTIGDTLDLSQDLASLDPMLQKGEPSFATYPLDNPIISKDSDDTGEHYRVSGTFETAKASRDGCSFDFDKGPPRVFDEVTRGYGENFKRLLEIFGVKTIRKLASDDVIDSLFALRNNHIEEFLAEKAKEHAGAN